MKRHRPPLETLLAAVDTITDRTRLISINEAVKTAQAQLAGHDITIAAEWAYRSTVTQHTA